MCNLAENADILARSNFNIFANVDLSTTNNGALESSYQGGFVLGLLAGDRDNYKNKLLVKYK